MNNINVSEWRNKFFKLGHRYFQTLYTLNDDFKFCIELLKQGKEDEAHWYFKFCEEVYSQNPTSEWSRNRYASWRRDIFAATTHQLLKGEEL